MFRQQVLISFKSHSPLLIVPITSYNAPYFSLFSICFH